MNKHCKDCKYYAYDFRNANGKTKLNDWCCKRGGPVNTGWCKLHNAKELKEDKHATKTNHQAS